MSDNATKQNAEQTEATFSREQILSAIDRVYNYDESKDFVVDRGMLATMLDQQQREIERLRFEISQYETLFPDTVHWVKTRKQPTR